MVESNCVKCGSKRFEVVHAKNLEGTTRTVLFVQCTECGGVISALDFMTFSFGVQMSDMKEDVQRVLDKLRKKF